MSGTILYEGTVLAWARFFLRLTREDFMTMEQMPTEHLTEAQLRAYVAQDLGAAEVDRMEQHLMICHHCRQRVDDLEADNTKRAQSHPSY